jgi:hypothetical protein
MRNLVIMPSMANNRERMNLGEYAEEATIIMDEPIKPANHFIEANTQEVTLNHLKNDCITPVFSKDNELENQFHMEKNRTKRRQAIAKSVVINT